MVLGAGRQSADEVIMTRALPLLDAAQVVHAQVRYLPFQGGTGVRFVAHYIPDLALLDGLAQSIEVTRG